MAKLDGEELKKYNRLLDELNSKKKKLNQDPVLDLDGTVENLGVLNQLLDVANENISDLNQSVEGIRESWGSIVGEIKKTNDISGVSVKSFNKLSSIADKLSNSQKGLNELSSRQISSLVTKTKIEEQNLIFQKKQLEAKGRSVKDANNEIAKLYEKLDAEIASGEVNDKNYNKAEKLLEKKISIIEKEKSTLLEVNSVLDKNQGLVGEQIDALKTQEKQTRNVERATGLTGVAMKGISGFLDKIGMSNMGEVFEDANLAAKATAERLTDGGKKAGGLITKIKSMGSAFKVVGKAVLRNLTDPLVLAGLAMKAMKGVFNFFADAYKKGEEAAMRISDENVNMARSLGISQKAASKLAGSVAGMGPTTAASKTSIEGIYKAMGSTEKLSRGTLKVFVKLNTMAGMSADSLAKFQKFAKKSGEDAGTLVTAMAKTAGSAIKNNKLAMTQRDLLEESANQSAYVKLQFAGQGPALVNAVAQSKALGLNMKSARDMASSLLNFEDSIAAEMEAELLTGKQLNLEEARALALKGDNVGAAKLIAEQVGGAAEFMSMNVIQQEALAKAAGMGVDEMSNMLSGQQDMKAEGDDLVKNQEDGIKAMTSQVSLREAAENRSRKAAEANISVYKELNGLVNTLKETWTEIQTILMESLTENVIKPLVDFITSEEGKKFLKELPDRVDRALIGIVNFAKVVKQFATDHPWITKALSGAVGGAFIFQITGLSMIFKTLGKLGRLMGIKIPKLTNIFNKLKMPNLTKIFSKIKLPNLTSIFSKIKIPTSAASGLLKTIGGKILAPLELVMGAITGVSQVSGKTKEEKKAAGIKESMGGVEAGVIGALTGNANKGSSLSKYVGVEKGSAGDEAMGIAASGARGAMVGAAIGSVVPVIGTAVGAAVGGIIGTVSEGFKVFSDPNSKLRQGVTSFVSSTSETLSGWASTAGENISAFSSAAGEKISGWASAAGGKILNFASTAGENMSNFLKTSRYAKAFQFIIDSVSSLGTKIKDKFITIQDKIVSIISSIPGKIIAKIKSFGGKAASLLGFATGGIAPGGFKAFADGGIVTKPTFGLVGEGSMNEAIIPLPDGKSVPVKVQGGDSSNSSNAQVITLLKELITVVKSGGDVTLDGQKVGTAMVAGSYRMQ